MKQSASLCHGVGGETFSDVCSVQAVWEGGECVWDMLGDLIYLARSVYASQENSACLSGLKSTYFHLNRLWQTIQRLVRCLPAIQKFLLQDFRHKIWCGVVIEEWHHHRRGMKCGVVFRSHLKHASHTDVRLWDVVMMCSMIARQILSCHLLLI